MIAQLLRRALRPDAHRGPDREREVLARGLDHLEVEAGRRRATPLGGSPPIVRAETAAACIAPARRLAALLRDPAVPVQPDTTGDIRRFLTDGCESPLFGASPELAFLAVHDLIAEVERDGEAYAGFGRNR